jgi:mono/diheme cytochrome c family protein
VTRTSGAAPPTRWHRVAAGLSVAAWLGGCTPAPPPQVEPVTPIGDVAAHSLGPTDPMAQAQQAVAAAIARRERRMREAWEPGSQWAQLRVEQADIDSGRVSLPQLLEIGQELFSLDFGPAQGLGNGLAAKKSPLAGPRPAPNLRHVQYKLFGGPDATRCVACHHLGGPGGAGFRIDNALLDGDGEHPRTALERNPRALWGAAVLGQLAAEMTAELRDQLATAQRTLRPGQSVPLSAKGVSFGFLRKSPSGQIDGSGVRGVRQDLIVRPFGWKGTVASLRQMVVESLQRNLGVQAEELVSSGPPGAAPYGDGPPADPDLDGVTREATTGMVTALTAYLAALTLPIEESPEPPSFLIATAQGGELFTKLGCAGCHVPELPLHSPLVSLGPGPRSRPRLDLTPLLKSAGRAERQGTVRLYSDLKMHDLGEELSEPRGYLGAPRHLWLTPPLWGLGISAPYLHDGRAGSIDTAIRAHGGEATAARDAYVKLSPEEGGALRLFLQTLSRPARLEFKP